MFNSKGNTTVWVIVGLLIVAAILLFAFSDGDGNGDTATTTDDTQQPAGDAATVEQVQSALTAGGSVECSFSDEDAVGTSYVSDGQVRVIAEAEGVTSNMIFVDGDVYVWQEGATEGISFNADSFPQYSAGAMLPARPADITQGVSTGDVACSVTDVDEDLFTLPETVTFASYATSSMQAETGGQLDDRN